METRIAVVRRGRLSHLYRQTILGGPGWETITWERMCQYYLQRPDELTSVQELECPRCQDIYAKMRGMEQS